MKNKSQIFDRDYFIGNIKSNYDNYNNCKYILERYAEILNNIFHPTSVFDAGCAYGFLVEWFISRGINAKGCDISSWACKQSKNIYQADILNIPEFNNEFDLVTCTEVLGHIEEENIKIAIKELYRISNNYVVMLVEMWDEPPLNGVDEGDITHVTFKPKRWWENIIKELGFPRDIEKEQLLNEDSFSKKMNWSSRFIVINKNLIL